MCEHGNRTGRCTRCEPLVKPKAPWKGCRCGRYILRDQTLCSRCHQYEDSIFHDQERRDYLRMMVAVFREVNA